MWRWLVVAVPLIMAFAFAFTQADARHSQISTTAFTPSYDGANTSVPNTFIAMVGLQVPTQLLPMDTPLLLWGAVPEPDVALFCQRFVAPGKRSAQVSVHNSWGGVTELLNLLIIASTASCTNTNATDDIHDSSIQIVVVDSVSGRQGAIICVPRTAAVGRCGVYVSGRDVERLYASSKLPKQQPHQKRRLADCVSGAEYGMFEGVVTGMMAAEECSLLGVQLETFCTEGVIGVSAIVGAIAGCLGANVTTSCFPAEATVRTRHALAVPISHLRVGDEVAVWDPLSDSGVEFQAVYALGHRDAVASAAFVEISAVPLFPLCLASNTSSVATLHLSPLHFIPTLLQLSQPLRHDALPGRLLYKRARDVVFGDVIWAAMPVDNCSRSCGASDGASRGIIQCVVKEVRVKRMQGLFNPLTMGGCIIVDGVVASVHSEWFLDPLLERAGMTHLLPHAYQLLLSPFRLLYALLGRKHYAYLYHWLDDYVVDVAKLGTHYGGSGFVVVTAAATFLGGVISRRLVFHLKTQYHHTL